MTPYQPPGRRSRVGPALVLLSVLVPVMTAGCSIKRYAVNTLGDAIATGGTVYAADDDPDLVQDAVPFSLKLTESLLAESPRHRGLLLAAASGFTQYAYAFVQQDADEVEDRDLSKATALRARARRLYLRARTYALRGLETRHRDFGTALRAGPKAAVRVASRADVPLLYWAAASWGAAISLSKDNPELIADQPIVEALIDRALELHEDFDHGAVHVFLITYEPSRLGATEDPAVRSRRHFDRAVQLSGGLLAAPFVALAEAVSIGKQDRKAFQALLARALEIDADARPEARLANLVMQRRARWLLGRVDELFLE